MTTVRQNAEWGLGVKAGGHVGVIPWVIFLTQYSICLPKNLLPTGSITNPLRFSVYRYLKG